MHREDLRELLREQGSGGMPDDAEVGRIQSALSLLRALPELDPSPDTWKKIESRLPSRRLVLTTGWARAAAAASILVAALSFAVVMNLPRTEALPRVVETGEALKWSDRYTAPQFATLDLPAVGTLKLNKNTTLRFVSSRCIVLEQGELFAEIIPSGQGFEVRSGDSTVRVKGTKFGVTSPSTVYVVEGAVEVSSPRGRLNLGPRQAAVESRLVEIGAEDHLRWLAQYEHAAVRLKLDLRDHATVTPGAPLQWNLILETDALVPLNLGKPRDVSQFISLQVDGAAMPLDASRIRVKEARTGPGGQMRLDLAHPCVLECSVDPALFREKGPVHVRAVYTSAGSSSENLWEGTVRSSIVTVEVR